MSQLHTSPASIAAALRRAADDLEAMGDVTLSALNLHVSLQAVGYKGTFAERKATVDACGVALTGVIGHTEGDEDAQHRLKSFTPRTGDSDMQVSVFTAVKDFTPGGAK